jgi:hypothetical protein
MKGKIENEKLKVENGIWKVENQKCWIVEKEINAK